MHGILDASATIEIESSQEKEFETSLSSSKMMRLESSSGGAYPSFMRILRAPS